MSKKLRFRAGDLAVTVRVLEGINTLKVNVPTGTLVEVIGRPKRRTDMDYRVEIPMYPTNGLGDWVCEDSDLKPISDPDASTLRQTADSRPAHLSHADIGDLRARAYVEEGE